jgi:hypothetical protein
VEFTKRLVPHRKRSLAPQAGGLVLKLSYLEATLAFTFESNFFPRRLSRVSLRAKAGEIFCERSVGLTADRGLPWFFFFF